MKKYKNIIWDWNGTLLNDLDLSLEVVNEMLEDHPGEAMSVERYHEIFDFPILNYYQKAGFNFEIKSFEDLCNTFIANYASRLNECQLQKGAAETIEKLHQQGVRQYVLSAAEQTLLVKMVNDFGLSKYFLKILGLSDNLANSKVANGLQLLKEMQLDPSKTVFIGDTVHDFEVAEEMGIDCILIPKGHHPRSKLAKEAALVIDDVSELLKQI